MMVFWLWGVWTTSPPAVDAVVYGAAATATLSEPAGD